MAQGRKHGVAKRGWAGIDFFGNSVVVAKQLIGKVLLLDGVGGVIVETEAYDQGEPAAHSFIGERAHNAALFGPPGRAYVYRSYGIHWCLNLVCREPGYGAGVLIRAIAPTVGIPIMERRRGRDSLRLLCSGPGRLGQALAVTPDLNGKSVAATPFKLANSELNPKVVRGRRIGLTKAVDLPWRFGLKDSEFLSVPFK
jgi:DNA-3-methyladenine glycosylase